MLQFDSTLVVIIVSFAVFMLLMQKIFYSPLQTIRRERQKYIDNNKSTAEGALEESGRLQGDYEAKIVEARRKSTSTVSQSTSEANQEKASIIAGASGKAGEALNKAKGEILADKNNAIDSLKPQVIALAHSISSKILGEEVSISGITPEAVDRILGR